MICIWFIVISICGSVWKKSKEDGFLKYKKQLVWHLRFWWLWLWKLGLLHYGMWRRVVWWKVIYILVESVVSDCYSEDADRWIIETYDSTRRDAVSIDDIFFDQSRLFVSIQTITCPRHNHFRLSPAVIYNALSYPSVTWNESLLHLDHPSTYGNLFISSK
jgi:hypothetical protein